MEVFADKFAIMGGGGGSKELPSIIQVYDITNGSKILTKEMLLHEEKIPNPYVPDFMYIARSGLNIIAVCLNETVALYKIEPTNGKLIHFFTEQADYAPKDSSVNYCILTMDNSILATGGTDCITRLHYLQKDFKGVDRQKETNGVVELSGPT